MRRRALFILCICLAVALSAFAVPERLYRRVIFPVANRKYFIPEFDQVIPGFQSLYLGTGGVNDGVFEAIGAYQTGVDITASGAGARFIWNPRRAAFRAGYVSGTDWDAANVGEQSIGLGYDTEATNTNSIAIGSGAISTGNGSISIGFIPNASQTNAIAIGNAAASSGTSAIALGKDVIASGDGATAIGYRATASGTKSIAMGCSKLGATNTTASGTLTIAIGEGLEVSGESSLGIALNDQDGTNVSQANTMAIMGGDIGMGVIDPDVRLELLDTGTQLKLSYDATNYATFAVAADGLLTVTTVDPDAAEADVSLMPDGNVGVNTADPAEKIHLVDGSILIDNSGGGLNSDLFFETYGTGRPGLSGKKARDTRASPSAVALNDILLFFGGRGYGATGFGAGSDAAIIIRAAEAFDDSSHGSMIHTEVTNVGATTRLSVQRTYFGYTDFQYHGGTEDDSYGLRFKTSANAAHTLYHKSGIFAVDNGLSNARNDLYLCVDGTADTANVAITDHRIVITQTGVGLETTSPDTRLQVVGDCKFGDDNTNFVNVGTAGDVTFVGTSGLIFGAMYNDNTSTTVTIGTAGTFVRIPSGFTAGQVNGATFGNARELTVTEPGMYNIVWSISFNTASGTNQDIEGAIGIDNTNNAQGTAHRFIGTASDIGNMGGTAILDLADNAVVSLMMTNNTNTVNIVVTHASLSLVQVGGT